MPLKESLPKDQSSNNPTESMILQFLKNRIADIAAQLQNR
jgi:hypothetical protein